MIHLGSNCQTILRSRRREGEGSAKGAMRLAEDEAVVLATTLRGVANTIRENLVKQLAAQLGKPGAAHSLDKSGSEVQAEAMQLALLMRGLPPTEQSRQELLAAISRHDKHSSVASFLQFWAQLSLMAGVYAPGAGADVQTSYVDWYRGPPGCARYLPSLPALRAQGALERFILQGWAPSRPLVRRDGLVTALGSCFADEIRIWLRERGYPVNGDFRRGAAYPHVEDSVVPLLQCSAGLVNTFVLRQQFEWAFEAREYSADLWRGARGEVALPTEAARVRTRGIFEQTDVFVVTLGLAEIWTQLKAEKMAAGTGEAGTEADGGAGVGKEEEEEAGKEEEEGKGKEAAANVEEEEKEEEEVLWRAVPSDRFDPSRHRFRLSTVEENVANLRRVRDLVREHVPGASIVFTLSPVPLSATFRGVSCVTANCVSKSVLRVAVDLLLQEEDAALQGATVAPAAQTAASRGVCDEVDAEDGACGGVAQGGGLYYWPAYEMVKEGFASPYLDDGKHVRPDVVQQVLSLFGEHYCQDLHPAENNADGGEAAMCSWAACDMRRE